MSPDTGIGCDLYEEFLIYTTMGLESYASAGIF